jgi:hypothetical protein
MMRHLWPASWSWSITALFLFGLLVGPNLGLLMEASRRRKISSSQCQRGNWREGEPCWVQRELASVVNPDKGFGALGNLESSLY